MTDVVEYGKYKYENHFPKKKLSTDVSLIPKKSQELIEFSYNNYWSTPKFKLKWFVGQAEYTPFHIIRQYLLELRAREDSIESQEYELKKVEIELKIAIRDRDEETDPLIKELLDLEVKRKTNGVSSTQARVKDLYIERQFFLELVEEFLNSPHGKTPDGRPLTSVLGTEEEELYEKEYWTVRLARQAAMDLCAYGRIGSGNLDAIMQLGADQREETLALAHTVNLAVEQQQTTLRQEAAKSLQLTNDGKMQYIGSLNPELINNAINADLELIKAASARLNLDNKNSNEPPPPTLPKEFNEIYNL
jgi:hypothetical protein